MFLNPSAKAVDIVLHVVGRMKHDGKIRIVGDRDGEDGLQQLEITDFGTQYLESNSFFCYTEKLFERLKRRVDRTKGLNEDRPSPHDKKLLNEKECRDFLKFASEKIDVKTTRLAAERIKAELPKVFQMFKESSQPNVPQWADRTTGREVSPVDWIRTHYGARGEDSTWDADGLTRADINQADRKLYLAYAKWIKRHPEDELSLPTVQRAKVADPEETLERHRAASRHSYHKSKHPR